MFKLNIANKVHLKNLDANFNRLSIITLLSLRNKSFKNT